jgi:PAS domain S-box-containing protein
VLARFREEGVEEGVNLLVILDAVELLCALAGLAFIAISWRRTLHFDVRLFIAAVLIFKVYHGFSNVMQWGGISLAFDVWEDYLELLVPGIYATLIIFFGLAESERRANEREERLRIVYDSIKDMVFAFEFSSDDKPGRIIDANAAFLQKLGYSREELLRLPVQTLEDVSRATASIEERNRSLKERGQIIFETVIVGKGGERRIEVEVNSHLTEIDGQLVNLNALRDITERKRTEQVLSEAKEDLERQNEELLKLDRMKDALISDISHELKTPVAKHVMQMEILRNLLGKYDVVAKVEDVLGIMESGIRRQQSVIRNILMMSRLEEGGREFRHTEVRLDKVLEETMEDWIHAIAAFGIRLESDLSETVVLGDEEMFWHVFSNIIGNAIKYRAKEDPKIVVNLEVRNGSAEVRIEDNGLGLSAKDQERVFDRFYQASPTAEGIGLGLSISQIVLKKFDGHIALYSEGLGKGTRVEVSLPLVT